MHLILKKAPIAVNQNQRVQDLLVINSAADRLASHRSPYWVKSLDGRVPD